MIWKHFTEQDHLFNNPDFYLQMLREYKENHGHLEMEKGRFAAGNVGYIDILCKRPHDIMVFDNKWVMTEEFLKVFTVFCLFPFDVESIEISYINGGYGPFGSSQGHLAATKSAGYRIAIMFCHYATVEVIDEKPKLLR